MNWKEVFDNLASSYDIGMRADVKEYLSEDEEVNSYNITVDPDDQFLIDIIFSGKYEKKFIYDFMKYIAYNHFCFFYNEKRGNDSLYYIYTERENDDVGIKFVVNVQKNKGDSDAK